MISLTKNLDPSQPLTFSDLMTREELMDLFKISKSTLHRWINEQKKLKVVKLNRRLYVRREDVENLIEDNTR
tara:strand:- start:180 stop:395 length:216 start_codon:yes stop_codon:yes gene_type:complete